MVFKTLFMYTRKDIYLSMHFIYTISHLLWRYACLFWEAHDWCWVFRFPACYIGDKWLLFWADSWALLLAHVCHDDLFVVFERFAANDSIVCGLQWALSVTTDLSLWSTVCQSKFLSNILFKMVAYLCQPWMGSNSFENLLHPGSQISLSTCFLESPQGMMFISTEILWMYKFIGKLFNMNRKDKV